MLEAFDDDAKKTGNFKDDSDVVIRRASDIEPQEIDWLWFGFLAAGKMTLLASDPGCGKSTVTIDIAARLSKGGAWPCEYEANQIGETIFLTAEDDASDTIIPRLMAAGADLDKVHILEAVRELDDDGKERQRCFNLQRDVERIGQQIEKMNNIKLLVIDPISSYLGRVDSHNNSDVRSVLAPLQAMASKQGLAVLLITHLNKATGGKAAYRATGSIAFSAAARISLLAGRDPDDEQRRVIVPVKCNLTPDNIGLAYRVVGGYNDAAMIEWETDYINETADCFLDRESDRGNGDSATVEQLKEFLIEPHTFDEIKKVCSDVGRDKLYRLITRAGAKKLKGEYQGAVKWQIDRTPLQTPGR